MLFANYEIAKIPISSPTATNLLILLTLLLIGIIFSNKAGTSFLDRTQTDQLKGIAILLVVVGHVWVHVSKVPAVPILSGYSVSLFLVLSGYGLTMSWRKRSLTFVQYAKKRLNRVMIPYWIITIIILILDYFLLNRTYSLSKIVSTFAGINFAKELRWMDYTRWYITLLLVYYLLFFLTNKFLRPYMASLALTICGLALYVLRRHEIFPFGSLHQIIAFPLGCWLANYHRKISQILGKNKNTALTFVIITVLALVLNHIVWVSVKDGDSFIFKLVELCAATTQGMLFSFFLILAVNELGSLGFSSKFFSFCGIISYEIYLIHGPLLIKYNPVFYLFPASMILVSFIILLIVILALSFLTKSVIGRIPFLYQR